jgi:hypothetical protein
MVTDIVKQFQTSYGTWRFTGVLDCILSLNKIHPLPLTRILYWFYSLPYFLKAHFSLCCSSSDSAKGTITGALIMLQLMQCRTASSLCGHVMQSITTQSLQYTKEQDWRDIIRSTQFFSLLLKPPQQDNNSTHLEEHAQHQWSVSVES